MLKRQHFIYIDKSRALENNYTNWKLYLIWARLYTGWDLNDV
jgi:hypothetical protein